MIWRVADIALKGAVNSDYTKSALKALHPQNIHVLQHSPNLLWSHHQKSVVVDQELAFIGGLDVCFGRFDDQNHSLVDNCHLATKYPGKDYYVRMTFSFPFVSCWFNHITVSFSLIV
jgi:phospholipase D1/2